MEGPVFCAIKVYVYLGKEVFFQQLARHLYGDTSQQGDAKDGRNDVEAALSVAVAGVAILHLILHDLVLQTVLVPSLLPSLLPPPPSLPPPPLVPAAGAVQSLLLLGRVVEAVHARGFGLDLVVVLEVGLYLRVQPGIFGVERILLAAAAVWDLPVAARVERVRSSVAVAYGVAF